MTTTPVSLLERLRQPCDPEAWARFVALYTPLIYAWGRRVGLQDSDAADLVQDVLLSLVQAMPAFVYDRHKGFRRWLHTLTLNKWRDRARCRATRALPGEAGLVELAAPDELDAFWEYRIVSTSSARPSTSCRRSSSQQRGRPAGSMPFRADPPRRWPPSWGSPSALSTRRSSGC